MNKSEEAKNQQDENSFDISKINAQLKKWRERLLDLTKSNPLLGLNRSRVSKLLVSGPDAYQLFNTIVVDSEAIKMPLVVAKRKRKKQEQEEEMEKETTEAEYILYPGDVNFDAQPKELMKLIRRVYDNSKTTIEERGVTTLHLTFGTLTWEDPAIGDSISPLLLVPCQLEKKGQNSNIVLKMLDEELLVNPALELYLREKHHVSLPQFPEEPNTESLKEFFSKIADLVSEQSWTVENVAWLSTFTFESLVIYKDLEAMADIARQNPVIAALAHAGEIELSSESIGEDLDDLDTPTVVPVSVMQADASQLRALTIANSGQHLIIHGPPGTGKSQTITNLIADALGKGKKVLFVSAKMAALNVVHDRLVKLGLGRYCLEAHSTKAGKAKIIEELKRTIEQPISNGSGQLEEQLEDFKKLQTQLNNYVKEIHLTRQPLGKTVYQAIGRVEQLHDIPSVDFDLPWLDPLEVSREKFNETAEVAENIAAQADVFDHKSTHPWRGFASIRQAIKSDSIKKSLQTLVTNFQELSKNLSQLSYLLVPITTEFSLSDLEELADVLDLIVSSQRLPNGWENQDSNQIGTLEKLFETAFDKTKAYSDCKNEYLKITTIPTKELQALLRPANLEYETWTKFLKPSFWQWKKLVQKQLLPGVDHSYSALRTYLHTAKKLETLLEWFDSQKKVLLCSADNAAKNPQLLSAKALQYKAAAAMQSAIAKNLIKKPSTKITDISNDDCQRIIKITTIMRNNELKLAKDIINSHWPDGFIDNNVAEKTCFSLIVERCSELLATGQKMHEWAVLQGVLVRCHEIDLDSFVKAIEKIGAKNAPLIFEKRFLNQWIESAMNTNSALMEFMGSIREDKIGHFKGLDEKIRGLMLKKIQSQAAMPTRNIISAQNNFGNGGEVGILRKELQKRKRIKPLRKLFAEIPHVLQAIKPCMLMSPVSVSTFLKPGALNFDLVVFDEASQLPTQEAIPSILRAKQVVVAGDENQLPPTSFFLASSIFEEEDETEFSDEFEPLESLLDDCVSIEPVFQNAKIVWHYRSKDERLIKFSNNYFYNNSLITFPSASQGDEGRGVKLAYTANGTWDKGKSRTNRIEAKKTAEIVIEQLQKYPDRTIGVVAMNSSQTEAIEYAIDELTANMPDLLPLLDTNRAEPFFIKSLENVQGDERDTIIISVGYGKTVDGSLSLNFGPLNRDGGWRRLNVLVTRAKWQTILVTSLHSHELGAINPNNRGALMLRNFIEYAEQGCRLPADLAIVSNEETNDFEDAVAVALRDRGFIVDEQVGASGYRIDLAIRDPRNTNRYLIAIECDGATYHSGRTARDRDILRQNVLESQGWKIYRLWSTDWFRDREKALKTMLDAIEMAKTEAPSKSVQAVPIQREQEQLFNATEAIMAVKKKYAPGKPYQKYLIPRKRDSKELLNKSFIYALSDVIADIVQTESPIHQDVLTERLKEAYGVSRAGTNIQDNITKSTRAAIDKFGLISRSGFIYKNEARPSYFRLPTDKIERQLRHIAPEEIENAILYLVEDQFGFAREQIAKAILEIFGLGRNWTEPTEIIETAVDRLIAKGKLNLNGYTIYIS